MADNEYALIVAAGKGMRFGGDLPKQFINLAGKPVIIHTLEAFLRYSPTIHIVLVLSASDMLTWEEISQKFGYDHKLAVQTGGPTRLESVRRGLEKIADDGFVAIHDGARPLVTPELIKASFEMAKVHNSAVAAVRPKDSIRIVADRQPSGSGSAPAEGNSRSIDRDQTRLVQTPQTFKSSVIKAAYQRATEQSLTATDDATVAEQSGYPVYLIEGSYENMKITTPEDVAIAEAILNNRRNAGA